MSSSNADNLKSKEKTTIHFISHNHWDREWFFTAQYAKRWLLPFFDNLFEMLQNQPCYRFRVSPRAVKIGVLAGILLNVYLWIFTPFFWLWWNFTGFAIAVVMAFIISVFLGTKEVDIHSSIESMKEGDTSSKKWTTIYKNEKSKYYCSFRTVCSHLGGDRRKCGSDVEHDKRSRKGGS